VTKLHEFCVNIMPSKEPSKSANLTWAQMASGVM
jgi:hypothetical protein